LAEILEGQLDELIIPLSAEAESKKLSELNNE
jgi:protein subunit release factor A